MIKLFYFTGTGNSLAAARQLAVALDNAPLVPMTQVVAGRTQIGDDDCIGLVFPVYAFGIPRLVQAFIDALQVPASTYIFAVATMGGMAGRTMPILRDALKARGLALAYSELMVMPGNFTPFYGAIPEAKQRKMFAKLPAQVQAVAADVRARVRRPPVTDLPVINWLLAGMYRSAVRRFATNDNNFIVDPQCNSCGLCAQVCPVGNITIGDGKPQWQHHCEQCLACLHFCPVEAIQFGKKTRGRKRYRHPDIIVTDLKAQSNNGH